jgi:hypothetical protein
MPKAFGVQISVFFTINIKNNLKMEFNAKILMFFSFINPVDENVIL